MRVTGGMLAGRILETPKGPRVRPTQDRVRAALFNILGDRVENARMLDLFAGSGAMGIEAFSRGASHATFVDQSPFCVRAIRENLQRFAGEGPRSPRGRESLSIGSCSEKGMSGKRMRGPSPAFRLLRSDAVSAIRKLAGEGALFDLVILDPPYGQELAKISLIALCRYAIVSLTGWVIAEHDKRDSLPAEIEGERKRLVLQRIERYGDTVLTFFA